MPAVKGDGMRGLAVFISDIRNCKSREAEVKRINKELANIRSKFKGDKTLDGYQKKKYVCKLLFIFLLGHDIDFGHMEAVNLLSSNKYTEKQIGYLFISVLVSANSELMKLVIQSIKNDLSSRNPVHVCLALQCIANIGSREMAEAFGHDIPKLLVSGDTIDAVKQSAALCLLRLIRAAPDAVSMSEWSSRIIHLLNDQHMGVVTAAVSLIESLTKKNPEEYKGCVSLAVSRLSRIVTSSYTDLQDYTYYFVPAPWLSVKLLRLLQYYPPPEDPAVKNRLTECLETILNKAQEPPKSKKVQHSNAKNAVLFEAINLIIHMDSDPNLLVRACNQLGQFLQHRETNLRYLALESMCLLATSEFSHDAVKKHQETVITALKTERDVSVRQRAVDLLYAMCDRSNAEEIVSEMLSYLETADYSIREEMVLKVAILAEKYAVDYTWYVDTILNLIRIAGDYVSEEVWYRVIQIVINRDDVQGYAAKTVFEALQAPACHENMVKVGGYILGEFGNLIAGDPRSSPMVQFQLLHSKFHLCSVATRGLLLSTYIKFVNLFPEIKGPVQEVLNNNNQLRNADVELQQRAVEYLQLSTVATVDVLATVLEEMPPFPERESSILAKLKKKRPEKIKEIVESLRDREPRPTAHINNNSQSSNLPLAPPQMAPKGVADLLGSSGIAPASQGNTLIDIGDLGGESSTDPISSAGSTGLGSLGNSFDVRPSGVQPEDQSSNLASQVPADSFLITPGESFARPVAPAQEATDSLFDLGLGGASSTPGLVEGTTEQFALSVGDSTPMAALTGELDIGLLTGGGADPLSGGSSELGLLPTDSSDKFICKNNGVMFENDLLQIGVKCEFRQNLGRIGLFYGNKTNFALLDFRTSIQMPPALQDSLNIQAKDVDMTIAGGEQKQQLFNVECISVFGEQPYSPPEITVSFMYSGSQQKFSLKLPLTLNKFIEATEMNSATFFQRWKMLSNPAQESQHILKSGLTQDSEATRARLSGFGFKTLENVDPNPDNFVCAGILHTKQSQIGCLLRLEPNKQAQMFRLTIRTSSDYVSKILCEFMASQLE